MTRKTSIGFGYLQKFFGFNAQLLIVVQRLCNLWEHAKCNLRVPFQIVPIMKGLEPEGIMK